MSAMDGRKKLKQMVLYVSAKMRDAGSFGSTKLNKVLFRVESSAYRELGRTITGFQYQKNERGPTLRAFKPITSEMEQEGSIRWEVRSVGATDEHRIIPLVEYDERAFSKQELEIIDREIQRAWSLTAKQMSDEEHQTAAWFATRIGESVRPELSFVEDPGQTIPLSDEEQEWAAAAIERYLARTGNPAHHRP
jgi:hypothetical protein